MCVHMVSNRSRGISRCKIQFYSDLCFFSSPGAVNSGNQAVPGLNHSLVFMLNEANQLLAAAVSYLPERHRYQSYQPVSFPKTISLWVSSVTDFTVALEM